MSYKQIPNNPDYSCMLDAEKNIHIVLKQSSFVLMAFIVARISFSSSYDLNPLLPHHKLYS